MPGFGYVAPQYLGAQMVIPQLSQQNWFAAMQQPQLMSLGGMPSWPLGADGFIGQSALHHQHNFSQEYSQYCSQPQQGYHDPVASFMQQLGIDPLEEQYFGWIAELALQTPLPSRWESCQDPATGCTYYVDVDLQTSSWDSPLLPYLQRIVDLGRQFILNCADEAFFIDAKSQLWQEQKDELDRWHGPFANNSGQQYYVNSASGTASVRDPRSDAQYVYELQSSFLSSLEEVLCPQPESPGTPGSHFGDSLGHEDASLSGGMWRTAAGAEVLTIDSTDAAIKSQNTERALRRLATLKANARVDHRSTFRAMSETYGWLHTAWADEEEVQRLKLRKLAKLRRSQNRRRSRGGSKNFAEPPSFARVQLQPAPAMEGTWSGGPAKDSSSPMGGRPAPVPLAFDDDEPFALTSGSMSSIFAAMVLPPKGRPSPANLVRPPPSSSNGGAGGLPVSVVGAGLPVGLGSALASAAEAVPADAPWQPKHIPASPSLHRRSPGQKWAAEGFLAKAVANCIPSADGVLVVAPLPPRVMPPELQEAVNVS